MGILLFVLPFVCSFFFLSKLFRQRYLHNHSRKKLHIWYTGLQRQVVSWDRKWAFSYLFFLLFVPFSSFPDFSSKISPQPFKIETSNLVYRFIHNKKLYRGIENGPSPISFSLYKFFFFLSRFFVKYISTTVKTETSYLIKRLTMTSCIVGMKMGLLLFVLPYTCSVFFLSRFFVKDISPQLFKIETSNLGYRFRTTSCIVGVKMGLLLFVLPYIYSFFFLSRFFVKDISTTV